MALKIAREKRRLSDSWFHSGLYYTQQKSLSKIGKWRIGIIFFPYCTHLSFELISSSIIFIASTIKFHKITLIVLGSYLFFFSILAPSLISASGFSNNRPVYANERRGGGGYMWWIVFNNTTRYYCITVMFKFT